MSEITIDSRYVVTDCGTSDGTQIKFYKDGFWYKEDRYGGEGEAEALAAVIMKLSSFDSERFVMYKQVQINDQPGCKSRNFLDKDEQFITLYRLHMNVTGRDPAAATSMMDYDDAIEYTLGFVKDTTGVDIRQYLADTFVLDEIIENTDRHFNNLGLIFDGENFRSAPIFDNGKSLGVGLGPSDKAYAKAFSGSFRLNREYLQEAASFHPDRERIKTYINRIQNQISDRAYNILMKTLSDI